MLDKLNISISTVALIVSIGAATSAFIISDKQSGMMQSASLQNKIDARKDSCVALSDIYTSQSWAYGLEESEPDPSLHDYANKTLAIVRALQLCQINNSSTDEELLGCINSNVDSVTEHKVQDLSPSGNIYTNLAC